MSEEILIQSFRHLFSQKSRFKERLEFVTLLKIAIPLIADRINLSKEEIKRILIPGLHQPVTAITL
jgi:hypothetical protein